MTNPCEEQVRRLHKQIGWVTRMFASLSATKEPGDIFSVVMSGYVSPECLGYSRIMYFECDEDSGVLSGAYSLEHESREEYNALCEELMAEAQFVRKLSESQEAVQLPDIGNYQGESVDDLHWLQDHTPWVITSQKMTSRNEITKGIKKLRYSHRAIERSFLHDVPHWKTARAFEKARLNDLFPEGLSPFLSDFFAVAPLHSFKGLRGIMIVDRRLDENPRFTYEQLAELDWYTRQAAVALENSDMNLALITKNEEMKQLDQLKSNFLSVISHELRTPLTSMSGFVALLLEGKAGEINENQRTLLTRVSKNTGHLSHLVNDLIEVAQTKAVGTVEVQIEPVDPLTILMNTLPKLEQRRRETHVDVECQADYSAIPKVKSDERALGRIFFHLLDNAMKFSPPGSTVSVNFDTRDEEFYISIKDQGVGIPKEKIRDIFQSFYQIDGTLTRGFEGLGLGLAVTRILVQATKARIHVESNEGEGSTFTVICPIVKASTAHSS